MSQISVPILWPLLLIDMRGTVFNLIWTVAKLARDTECPEFSISSFSSSCLRWVNLRLKLGWVRLHTRLWFALERPAQLGRSGSIPYYTRLEYKRDCPRFNVILLLVNGDSLFHRHFSWPQLFITMVAKNYGHKNVITKSKQKNGAYFGTIPFFVK